MLNKIWNLAINGWACSTTSRISFLIVIADIGHQRERVKKNKNKPWQLPFSWATFRAQRRDCIKAQIGGKEEKKSYIKGCWDHSALHHSEIDNQDSSQSWPSHQNEQSGQKDLCMRDNLEPKESHWPFQRFCVVQKVNTLPIYATHGQKRHLKYNCQ